MGGGARGGGKEGEVIPPGINFKVNPDPSNTYWKRDKITDKIR